MEPCENPCKNTVDSLWRCGIFTGTREVYLYETVRKPYKHARACPGESIETRCETRWKPIGPYNTQTLNPKPSNLNPKP